MKKTITIIFLGISAVLLLLGAWLLPWWVGELESGYYEVGLRGMRMCLHSICGASKSISALDPEHGSWAKMGTIVFATSLVAVCLLLVSFISLWAGKGYRVVYWLAGVSSMFAGLLAILFIVFRPDDPAWTPDFGIACAVAGAFLGALAVSVAPRQD